MDEWKDERLKELLEQKDEVIRRSERKIEKLHERVDELEMHLDHTANGWNAHRTEPMDSGPIPRLEIGWERLGPDWGWHRVELRLVTTDWDKNSIVPLHRTEVHGPGREPWIPGSYDPADLQPRIELPNRLGHRAHFLAALLQLPLIAVRPMGGSMRIDGDPYYYRAQEAGEKSRVHQ